MDLLPFDQYAASLPRKRAAAGTLLYDESRTRVLLIETTYKVEWEIPGGTVDADEAPWATAVRETAEELGITRPLGRLLVIDHVRTQGVMPEALAFVFDGGVITNDQVQGLRTHDPEVRSIGLYTVGEAQNLVTSSLHRRIEAAFAALATGTLMLCDAGTPTSPD
ncbi:NUDIX domain-containing protein [Actinokineospora inagensis]|uniref:NUDIX domain-containing protein n=1 Tax=Actinokineospora inagensis TaxID=103730 RepID=UPI00041051B3|nr:NUDIX hydrolase [Actinokineospora inagensis]